MIVVKLLDEMNTDPIYKSQYHRSLCQLKIMSCGRTRTNKIRTKSIFLVVKIADLNAQVEDRATLKTTTKRER